MAKFNSVLRLNKIYYCGNIFAFKLPASHVWHTMDREIDYRRHYGHAVKVPTDAKLPLTVMEIFRFQNFP